MLLVLSMLAAASARQSQRPGQEKGAKNNDVVRIGVTLVQLDVTVTDGKGNPVSDLRAEDFELEHNGKPVQISNFSYVSVEAANQLARSETARVAERADKKGDKRIALPLPPPVKLKPEQVRRTIALVVDDLTLSFESTHLVREALRKFVNEQMQEGDLAAIIRTGAGMGALQQFTNDRQQLYAAIDRVRWKPGYSGINAFAPVTIDPTGGLARDFDPSNVNTLARDKSRGDVGTPEQQREKRLQEQEFNKARDLTGDSNRGGRDTSGLDMLRQQVFAVGTLGALGFLVRGLQQLPGRKSVVLFSDALRIYNREEGITRVQTALDNLIDQANRASVVIYTIDSRGLQTLGITAADDLSGDIDARQAKETFDQNSDYSKFFAKTETALTDRRREFFEAQEGLSYLAHKTGGLFIRNTNDLGRGVSRALREQEGYYLIGFVPDEDTFKEKGGSRAFHDVSIKVKRPGLRVRTRTGFYGATDQEASRKVGTAGQQLLTALASPFSSGDIGVRMTAQFGHDRKQGPFVNAMLHIDARDLQFEEIVNGWRKTTIEIAAFTFGDNGQVIDQSDRAYSISMSDSDYRRTLERGIFYRINLPIKKAGAYQLRTAVRDHLSGKLGSANQFIEIPDVKKARMSLGGIVVRGYDSRSDAGQSARQVAAATEGKVEESNPQASPAVRRFERGMALDYAYIIYNAKTRKETGRPHLETRVRMFRDGKEIFATRPSEYDGSGQSDPKQIVAGGRLLLGGDLAPGEYALQVVVVDKAEKDPRPVAQWIDFEIVK
jgi:VWFA-related protein